MKSRVSEICQKVNVSFNKHPKTYMFILIVVVVLLLIIIPPIQVHFWNIDNATTNADLDNKFRLTLAQIVGGIAVFVTLYFTRESLNINREGQMTERFTKATIQLKNKNEEIRLGAIYTLGSILDNYEETYWPIMEILTQFVRNKAKPDNIDTEIKGTNNLNKISLDVQTVLMVFGKRKYRKFKVSDIPDLHNIYLRKAQLEQAYFEGANFKGANLEEANLRYADLQGVNLRCANLQGADFEQANLQGAYLEKANLERAYLEQANLERANLEKANLEGTDLRKVNLQEANLEETNLKGTDLRKSNLQRANLKKANLERANLEKANLMGAKNLEIDQLSKVKTLYNAKLDQSLREKLEKKYLALFNEPNDLESLRN